MDKREIDNQQKKDDEAIPVSHLETRSSMEEDNTWDCKTNDVDNHADTDDLTKIGLVPTSRIEGHRENPQDDSGVETSSAKEDNGNGTFPADLIYKYYKNPDDRKNNPLNYELKSCMCEEFAE